VDDTLGGRHVDALDRRPNLLVGVLGPGLGGGGRTARPRLQLGAHGLVAVVAHLVLTVALDLALDVGHGETQLLNRGIATGVAGTG
jgi:hypothetical protein